MSSLRKIRVMAGADLHATLRDRQGAFFMLVLPIAVILLIGLVVTGQGERLHLGVAMEGRGPLATHLLDELKAAPTVKVATYDSRSALDVAVRRGEVSAGVVVPAGYDRQLTAGEGAQVGFVALSTNPSAPAFRTVVDSLATREAAAVSAARLASDRTHIRFDEALTQARAIQRQDPAQADLQVDAHKGAVVPGGFTYTAPTSLVLFMFINAMAIAGVIAWIRKLGVIRRMLATPTSVTTVLLGLGAGRFIIVFVQGLFIIVIGAAVFGVKWGDPLALAIVVLLFCVLSAGAAMIVGARANGLEQSIAIGAPLGIAVGMLGGCMWPLAIVGHWMNVLGHLTPHAWAVDALMALTVRHAGLGGIMGDIAALAAFAAGLVALGSWQLRRVLATTT